MLSTAESLAQGNQLHRAGDLARAAEVYRSVLQTDPTNVDAWCLLAAAVMASGQVEESMAHLNQALQLNPRHAAAHDNLGIAQFKLGRVDEAVACFRSALHWDPSSADTYLNLGIALTKQGESSEAEVIYRAAILRWPNSAIAHFQLGNLLKEKGCFDDALAAYQRAHELNPNDPKTLNNLGVVLLAQERLEHATIAFQQAICLQPDFAGAYSNLSNTYREQGKIADAIGVCREALKLAPESPEAYNSLGTALLEAGEPVEALKHIEHALQLKPDHTIAYINQTSVLLELGRPDEALHSAERAVEIQPDFPEAHTNRAMVALKLGRFEEGWREYEWRWKSKGVKKRDVPGPHWDGSALTDRTILLQAEQGLGDTLQFIRYASIVKSMGGTVIVECQESLRKILSRSAGIDRFISQNEQMPGCDVHAPLLSLPMILGTTLQTVPAQVPYIFPDPILVQSWRNRLAGIAGFKVGIVWQGSKQHKKDRQRSIPLARFAPLSRVSGVQLISLQKGPGTEQIHTVASEVPLIDFGAELDETAGPFMDTAAIMGSLDLVICADTATAHLAGALGVPTWLALPIAADFRWLLDRNDSPWYPTIRLFRQKQSGDWQSVFQVMASELQRIARQPNMRRIMVGIAPGELFDKIAILEIKSRRFTDPVKLSNVRSELAALTSAKDQSAGTSPQLDQLIRELQLVNERLWDIEDLLRLLEKNQDFGPAFIELARSVYRENDRRAAIKRQINGLLGSEFIEEKSYEKYA
jgi:tetratricopeptide (TPR) repeat protein